MTQKTTTIPDGYLKNARGHLIPESEVKPVDKMRDQVVTEIIKSASQVAEFVAAFKSTAFELIENFAERSAAEHDIHLGGSKGNITLLSFDGNFKIVRAVQEQTEFDENLNTAKALIDKCLEDWSEGSQANLKELVNDAFKVNSDGRLNTVSILGLRRHNFDDKRWRKAMDLITESIVVTGQKTYLRVYKKNQASGNYELLPLDVSKA